MLQITSDSPPSRSQVPAASGSPAPFLPEPAGPTLITIEGMYHATQYGHLFCYSRAAAAEYCSSSATLVVQENMETWQEYTENGQYIMVLIGTVVAGT